MVNGVALAIVCCAVVLIVLLTWLVSTRFLWAFLFLWVAYVGYLLVRLLKEKRNPPHSSSGR